MPRPIRLIRCAKLVDADARAVRKRYEDTVEAPLKKNSELLAKARFAIYGTCDLSRRHLHPAAQLRRGEGLAGAGPRGQAVHHHGRRVRAGHRPPALRAATELAGRQGQAAGGARRSTSSPPTTSSAATPARRWWTRTAPWWAWSSTATSTRWAATTASTRPRTARWRCTATPIIEALAKIYGADRLVSELRPKRTKLGRGGSRAFARARSQQAGR